MSTTKNNSRGPGRPPNPTIRAKRRKEILSQAVIHFAEHGFTRTDVAAIAKSAGCSKGTIYNYFSNKRALFRDTVDHVMEGLIKTIYAYDDDGSIKGFGQAIEAFLRYFDEHPAYIELLVLERAVFKNRKTPTYIEYSQARQERYKRHFEKLIGLKLFRDRPIERTQEIISDLLYGTIFTNYFANRKPCLEQQASDITDLLLNGLLSREHDPQGE